MNTNNYQLDWDSTIEADDREYIVLPEGDYAFTVDHVDRSYVGQESEKYAGCKMATVYMNVHVPGQEDVQIRENFILHSNFAWKIGALLVCVGLKKKGEPISGNYWNQIPGTNGRCSIVQNASRKNPETKFNNVAKFYEPDEANKENKWAV